MSLSKARDAARKREERAKRGHSRLDVQLKLTPELADYLEAKAGDLSVEAYLLAQIHKSLPVGRPT